MQIGSVLRHKLDNSVYLIVVDVNFIGQPKLYKLAELHTISRSQWFSEAEINDFADIVFEDLFKVVEEYLKNETDIH